MNSHQLKFFSYGDADNNYTGINNFSPAVRKHIRRNLSRLGLNWSGVINWYTNSVPAATARKRFQSGTPGWTHIPK